MVTVITAARKGVLSPMSADDQPRNLSDETKAVNPDGQVCDLSEDEKLSVDITSLRTVPKPRIWTALVVGMLAIILATIVATFVTLVAVIVDAGRETLAESNLFFAWIQEFSSRPQGLIVLLLPGQVVFLIIALGAAWLSPVSVYERVGFVKGRLPILMWPLIMAGTPFVGWLAHLLLLGLFDHTGEQLEMLDQMVGHQQGGALVLVFFLVAMMPGISEEILFRGYVQRRLLARLPVWAAIGISSSLFATAHMEPLHIIAVFPLGLWLGVVAWRSGSVILVILCHIMNNTLAIVSSQSGVGDVAHDGADPFPLIGLSLSGAFFLVALFCLGWTTRESVLPTSGTNDDRPV